VPELSLALGGVCLDRADSRHAKIAFARALSIVPGHNDALVGFGVALQYEGDFARAAERFRRVLAHDPAHHRARMNLGYCLIELGQLDDGIACLRAAVEAAPAQLRQRAENADKRRARAILAQAQRGGRVSGAQRRAVAGAFYARKGRPISVHKHKLTFINFLLLRNQFSIL